MPFYEPAPRGSSFENVRSAVFIPEVWQREVIRQRDENLVMRNLVGKIDFRGQKGDTIYRPFISNFAVRNKASGTPVEYQSWDESRWSMVVNRYKEVSFSLDRITELFAQNDLRAIYTERAGWALSRDVEYSLLAERATIQGYNTLSNVITSGAPLDYTDILAGVQILQEGNVPLGAIRLVISPAQHASLLTQDEFISADYSSLRSVSSTGNNGLVGVVQALGIPVYVTNSIVTNSATGFKNGDEDVGSPTPGMTLSEYYPTQSPELKDGTTVTASTLVAGYDSAILCHPEWCMLAMVKEPSVDYQWSVDYQEHHVVQTQVFDVKVYRPDHAVIIHTTE